MGISKGDPRKNGKTPRKIKWQLWTAIAAFGDALRLAWTIAPCRVRCRVAERLGRLKGRFIMSINDVPEIRSLFEAFELRPVELTYSISSGAGTAARELIIHNER